MYFLLCLPSNSDALCYQIFHARSFSHISGFPQSLHANLGFVGLSKISARHFEICYSILYNLGH